MDYHRVKELKAFDDTKLGVQGLVAAGVAKVPKIFIQSDDEFNEELDHPRAHIGLPMIDLDGLMMDQRRKIVDEVRKASEEWGFFQVVNHGMPISVMNNMLDGIRRFNEQDNDVKKEFYSRDRAREVRFYSNYDLFKSKRADWRDTLSISLLTADHVDPEELPIVCRDEAIKFVEEITKIGDTLFELLSESLGLRPDHLGAMECNKGRLLVCNYYPACPEPELAMGITKHTDSTFLTILAQDQIGGLQVLHQNQWVDVQPIAGSLVVNIGDLLQIISNDKFKSNLHRVLPSSKPRVSAACFFSGRLAPPARVYGPIKDLISEENPPIYRDVLLSEYISTVYSKGLYEKPNPKYYRL